MTARLELVRRWARRILPALAALAAAGVAVYWFRLAPVPVEAYQADPGKVVAEVMGTGTLEARVRVTVSPKIPGRLAAILADQGDRVSAGQVLVRLDDEELRQQVAIASANRESAEAALVRLRTDKTRAVAVYEQAQKSHDRMKALIESGTGSRDDLDRATEAFAVAETGIARAEAAIAEGQKELVAAERTTEYHRARLADTEVRAPSAGLVVRRHKDPGDVVVPGGAVLTLIGTDEVWISAWVDETEMARVAVGQPARVVFRSEPDRSYPGTVARLGREADRESREFVVDVRVLDLPTNWAVGQRAETYVEIARAAVPTRVPPRFISTRDGRPGVYALRDGAVRWRPVTLGVRGRELVGVTDGLAVGEVVVTPEAPGDALRDGRKVRVR
jgi:RND family efflux transporter MFP subunit